MVFCEKIESCDTSRPNSVFLITVKSADSIYSKKKPEIQNLYPQLRPFFCHSIKANRNGTDAKG